MAAGEPQAACAAASGGSAADLSGLVAPEPVSAEGTPVKRTGCLTARLVVQRLRRPSTSCRIWAQTGSSVSPAGDAQSFRSAHTRSPHKLAQMPRKKRTAEGEQQPARRKRVRGDAPTLEDEDAAAMAEIAEDAAEEAEPVDRRQAAAELARRWACTPRLGLRTQALLLGVQTSQTPCSVQARCALCPLPERGG